MRKLWSPDTPCDCRINIHKICWERWAEYSYEACIICRASKYRPDPPAAAIIPLHHPPAHHIRGIRRVVFFVELTMFGLIIYMLFLMVTYSPPISINEHTPRPVLSWLPLPYQPPYRDEL